MTRFFRSWLRSVSDAMPTRRRAFVPCVYLLEDRTLPSVQFTPAPYAVPGDRPDTPLTHIVPTSPVEPYVSVNPADPDDIAVSSQGGIRVSTSAGGSFTGASRFPVTSNGDTATTYDSAGRLFWVNITSSGGVNANTITIAQVDPTTGGIIASHLVDQVPDSSFREDKEFIAADPSTNNLYVIWVRGEPATRTPHILMRYSSDQGVSWSNPVQVDNGSDGRVFAPTVTVAPDHRVYAAYHSVSCLEFCGAGDIVPDHDGQIVVVRFNNALMDPVRSIAEAPGRADVTYNLQTAGAPRQIPGATFWTEGYTQPWILADPVRSGNVYVISADSNNGFHQDYGDIRLARSTDYGMTWSSSLIETSSTIFPNAAIDRFGDIVVAWYDNRRGLHNAAGHFKLDVYATYSTDGGLTFAPAFPVNDQTPGVNTPDGNIFDPDPGAAIQDPGPPPTTRIGEYFGIAIWGGTAYVAWNGNRFAGFNNPVDQQVWMKSFAIQGSLTVTGTAGNDYLNIRTVADNRDDVEVIVNGQRQYAGLWSALTAIIVSPTGGNDILSLDDTLASTPVTVDLGNGNDIVVISGTDGDLDTIQGPVSIHGGSGSDVLVARDEYHNANTAYAITGSSVARPGWAGISYDHISTLNVYGGFGDDTYNVQGSLQGQVNVNAGLSSNILNLDDESNTADTTYTITATSLSRTGSGTVNYSNITDLVLTGGSGTNTYNVPSTRNQYPTTLNTGNGSDTVNVRGAAGPLFLNSGSGGDTITLSNSAGTLGGIGPVILNDPSNRAAVTVDDSGFAGSTTYTVTSTQVTAVAWPNLLLTYNNPARLDLNGSSGDDQFNIESAASATATTVTAGSGGNRFEVSPTAQYLTSVAGPLSLLGSGADTLVFWDTANLNAETYTFDDVPSSLSLATVPVSVSFVGMAAVYLETNGMSTVNDPSGSVLIDTPPPSGPDAAQEPPVTLSSATEGSLAQALPDTTQKRKTAWPAAPAGSDLLSWMATRPREDPDLPAWAALEL
jgi:hypothetical protein